MLGKSKFVVFIPGFIHRSLIRNKFNIVEFTDYTKLRKVLTIEDLALFISLNQNIRIDNSPISVFNYRELFNSMTSEEDSEFSRSVLPLSGSENIVKVINSNLTDTSNLSIDNMEDKEFYKFFITEDVVFVVLNEGFITKLSDDEFKSKFIKEYISKMYVILPIHEVSKTNMFSLYIKNLNKTSVQ